MGVVPPSTHAGLNQGWFVVQAHTLLNCIQVSAGPLSTHTLLVEHGTQQRDGDFLHGQSHDAQRARVREPAHLLRVVRLGADAVDEQIELSRQLVVRLAGGDEARGAHGQALRLLVLGAGDGNHLERENERAFSCRTIPAMMFFVPMSANLETKKNVRTTGSAGELTQGLCKSTHRTLDFLKYPI